MAGHRAARTGGVVSSTPIVKMTDAR